MNALLLSNTPIVVYWIITVCTVAHLSLCYVDPLQFAYRQYRSTDGTITLIIHNVLTYMDKKNTYRMCGCCLSTTALCLTPSSHVSPSQSSENFHLRNWILYFLTSRHQVVKFAKHLSSTQSLSTGAPQGCVQRPLLYCHTQLQHHL